MVGWDTTCYAIETLEAFPSFALRLDDINCSEGEGLPWKWHPVTVVFVSNFWLNLDYQIADISLYLLISPFLLITLKTSEMETLDQWNGEDEAIFKYPFMAPWTHFIQRG